MERVLSTIYMHALHVFIRDISYLIKLVDSLSRISRAFCFVRSWDSNGNSFFSSSHHFPLISTWIFLLDFLKVLIENDAGRESLIAKSVAAILKLFTRQSARKMSSRDSSFTRIAMKWQHVIRFSVVCIGY